MIRLLWKSASLILFILLVLLFVGWLVFGSLWIRSGTEMVEEEQANQAIAAVERSAPSMAQSLRELQANTDPRALFVAIRAGEEGSAFGTVATLAEQNAKKRPMPGLELARIASNPALCRDRDQREVFLTSHGAALQLLAQVASDEPLREYITLLNKSAKDTAFWEIARGDPMTMYVWEYVSSPELRQFYLEEREWLAEVVALLIQDEASKRGEGGTEEIPLAASASYSIKETVEIAKRYYPLTKEAVLEGAKSSDGEADEVANAEVTEFGVLAFSFFYKFGEAIERSVRGTEEFDGIPLAEVLDVLFADLDAALEIQEEKGPQGLAAMLLKLRESSIAKENAARLAEGEPILTIWEAARKLPLVLRLYWVAPEDAEAVIEKFGTDDIAVFLYAKYEDEIPVATKAVKSYGDLGIYILNHYADEERFHALLDDPKVGSHAVPYVAQFQDQGLDRYEENTAWFDKYFNADGTEKEEGWFYSLPIVGGPAKIVKNYKEGVPNEWSELGWAALDVADGALLVATLGTAVVAKGAAGQAVKTTAKSAARKGGRIAAERSAKGARLQVRAAVKAKPSYFQQFRNAVARRSASETRLAIGALAGVTGRLLSATKAQLVRATKAAVTSIKTMSPQLRTSILRGTLSAGLAVTITFRTIPALWEVARPTIEGFARSARELAEKIIPAVVTPILGAINSLGQLATGIFRQRLWIYLGSLLGLALLCYWFRPRRRSVRYA